MALELETDVAVNARCEAVPIKDRDGFDRMAVIVKYTFCADASGFVRPDEEPPLVDLVDTYNGKDPATSSIRRPSQLFEAKPGTDVILLGHAHPPRGGAATHVDVSLRVGPISKTVRAYGLRVWQEGAFGTLLPGPARPIREPVPLIYELAWGGLDLSDPTKAPVGEPRNYVGRGVAREHKRLVDEPAAQLEDPAHPVGKSKSPIAFNPIHRHWQPRVTYAGTYDEEWLATRMPLLPKDFDYRYHVCVPPDQWSERPMRGDEPFEIMGATPEGLWRFQLPRLTPGFSSYTQGVRAEHRTHLDTILIDCDAKKVELTWRASMLLPKKWEMLERILIFEKEIVS